MNSMKSGEELNQMARLLFDSAANKWYVAMIFEVGAGIIPVVFGLATVSDQAVLVGAMIGTVMLLIAYGSRLWAGQQYGIAETMRRQSVFSEALGWVVSRTQMSQWRQSTGKRIVDKIRNEPREVGYYEARVKVGPKRLADMTIQSAFYTRHLYGKMSSLAWLVFVLATSIALLMIGLGLTQTMPGSYVMALAKVLFGILPTALAVDVFGWALKLGWTQRELSKIEEELEHLVEKEEEPDMLSQVLRLVSEYNCVVVSGIPIHKRWFEMCHEEIQDMWAERCK